MLLLSLDNDDGDEQPSAEPCHSDALLDTDDDDD